MKAIPHRTVISLTGPDTLALLERTVTHTVTNWETGEMRFGGLLTPQGKIIADYLAVRTDDGVLIDIHADAQEDFAKRLKMFRLRADVQIEPRDDLSVLETGSGMPDPRHSELPSRLIAPKTTDNISTDHHARRIAAGIPEWGSDYRSSEVFPSDVNMGVMGGVDYSKGCFVGQEVASRMKRRGKIRKRTVLVRGKELSAGQQIMAGELPVGKVTSSAGSIALARIRVDRAAGKTLSVNEHVVKLDVPEWLEIEMSEGPTE